MITVRGFDWDDEDDEDGNVAHILRHDVRLQEVEQVLRWDPMWIPEKKHDPQAAENEWMILGTTKSGRILRVHGCIYEDPPRKGWWRTFTAFEAPAANRRQYESWKAGQRAKGGTQ